MINPGFRRLSGTNAGVRFVCALVLGGVFLCAAAAKAWDGVEFQRFAAIVLTRGAFESVSPRAMLIVVVVAEALVGVAVVIARRHALSLAAAGLMLLAFTALLVWLKLHPTTASCGCFGPFGGRGSQDAGIGLARNACLLYITGWLMATRRTHPSSDAARDASESRVAGHARAFTLIEVLVVIAVVAILLSLALPALAKSRYKGREIRSLATQRELCRALVGYAADEREAFPYMAVTPGDPFSDIVVNGFRLPNPEGYFRNQTWHWTSLMLPRYFDAPRESIETPEATRLLRDVLRYPESILRSHFFLSYTVFAAPEYWQDGPASDHTRLRATRWPEVAFPSQKGLTLDISLGAFANDKRARDSCYSALADGSARIFSLSQVDPARVSSPPLLPGYQPVMATTGGLRGIDF